MGRILSGSLWTAVAAILFATSALAQEGHGQPQMTPEQQAEMEAYMKAATPGAPHQALAATAGKYDLIIKGWQEGAPPSEEKGTATRTMILGGRVMVEDVSSSMMGMSYTGHG